jgi:hypothetical protein
LVLAVLQLVVRALLAALAQLGRFNAPLAAAAIRFSLTPAIEAHQQTAAVVAVVALVVGFITLAAAALLDIQAAEA